MSQLVYSEGDPVKPHTQGNVILCHLVDRHGVWGKGIAESISEQWKAPEQAFLEWSKNRADNNFGLGHIQVIKVEDNLWVANMVAQQGQNHSLTGPPIRYRPLGECLGRVAEAAKKLNASVQMPRIGVGAAGGKWERIEPMIHEYLCDQGIAVTIVELEGQTRFSV